MVVDLRSDTVTRPSAAMRKAMAAAEVGDDVYGEDPSVNRLEKMAAERFGCEAALFVASGTQSNLCALLTHCGRGDEYIAGQMAHTYRFEGGGAAVLGGIQPQPIPFEADGSLNLDSVRDVYKPDDFHFAKTRLLCLENTQSGRAVAPGYFSDARKLADELNMAIHLDGARICNAAIAHDVDPTAYVARCDSVSVCLSKGLGAPVGSVLLGSAPFVRSARRWRKMLGGGMRQAGILAAAGIFALENNVERLQQDHERAAHLASGLAEHLGQNAVTHHTNMVFLDVPDIAAIRDRLLAADVLISGPRLVVHLDIDDEAIERVIRAMANS